MSKKWHDPRGTTLFVGGPPESGKSALMWHQYTSRCPRILTLEVVEETLKLDPKARRVFGYDELKDAMKAVAGERTWHIVASIKRDDVERLFGILCPELESSSTRSYARAVGGMVVACSELAYAFPRGLSNESRRKDAYLRYRHHWLSIYGATQHAPDADPCTRLGVERAVFLRISDDLGLDAVKRAASSALADVVAILPKYHALTCLKREGRAYLTDENYRPYGVLDYRGKVLSGTGPTESAALSAAESLPAEGVDTGALVMTHPVQLASGRESGTSQRFS